MANGRTGSLAPSEIVDLKEGEVKRVQGKVEGNVLIECYMTLKNHVFKIKFEIGIQKTNANKK